MPYPLAKAPDFLLSLFRLRTLGAQPNQFSEQVIPVVDTTNFYGNNLLVTGASPNVVQAFPANVVGDVGTTSRYMGVAGIVTIGAAAGTFLMGTVFAQIPNAGQTAFPLFPTLRFTGLAVASTVWFGGLFASPMVFPSGTRLSFVATSDAGGADHTFALRLMLMDPLRDP